MTERLSPAELVSQPSTQVVLAIQDREVSAEMDIFLRNYGFLTETVFDLNKAQDVKSAVLILDENFLNGDLTPLEDLSLIQEIPTIVIGDRTEDSLRQTELLLTGADYYVSRSPHLIAACIKAIERRRARDISVLPYYKVGDVELNFQEDLYLKKGQKVDLTPRERGIIKCLLQDPSRFHSNSEILTSVWGFEWRDDKDYVRVYVRRVRGKLGFDFLENHWSVGYRVKQGGITRNPNL